jgi:signal transduction histidine kinase
MVSHDLRNPLATVQLAATMLLSRAEPRAPERRQLEMIARSCRRMEKLIDDLLAASSIQAGRLAVTLRPEPAARLVTEALELQRGAAEERRLRLVWSGGLEGVVIPCDRDRVLQVFANLIGNAIKFCRPGDAITLSGERTDGAVRFTIADTGPGVPGEAAPHLFEPYWSAPEHARRGSGLGLYISRGIVEAHGGRIWVEDAPGGGASFSFTLPLPA